MSREHEKKFIDYAWGKGLKFTDIDWDRLKESYPGWDLEFVKRNVRLGRKHPILPEVVVRPKTLGRKAWEFAKQTAGELVTPITMFSEISDVKELGKIPFDAMSAAVEEIFPRKALYGATMHEMIEAQGLRGRVLTDPKDIQRKYELDKVMAEEQPHKPEPSPGRAIWHGMMQMMPLGEFATGQPEAAKAFPKTVQAGHVYGMIGGIVVATKMTSALFPKLFGKGTYSAAPGMVGRMFKEATSDLTVGRARRFLQLPISGAVYGQLRKPGDPIASVEDAIGFMVFGLFMRAIGGVAKRVIKRYIKREPTEAEVRELISGEIKDTELSWANEVDRAGKTFSELSKDVNKEIAGIQERIAEVAGTGIAKFDTFGRLVPDPISKTGTQVHMPVVALNEAALGEVTQVWKVLKILPDNKLQLERITGKKRVAIVDADKVVDINALIKENPEAGGMILSAFKDEPNYMRAVMGPEVGEATKQMVLSRMEPVKKAWKGDKKVWERGKVRKKIVDWEAWDKAKKELKLKPVLIPKFKNTEEALNFGRLHAGNKAIRDQLIWLRKGTSKKAEALRKQKKFDEGMEVATEDQFYREALEAMTEKPKPWKFREPEGVRPISLEPIKKKRVIKEAKTLRVKKLEPKPGKEKTQKFFQDMARGWAALKEEYEIDLSKFSREELAIEKPKTTGLASLIDDVLARGDIATVRRRILADPKMSKGQKLVYLRMIMARRKAKKGEYRVTKPGIKILGGVDIWHRITRDWTQMTGRKLTRKDMRTEQFKEILRLHGFEPEPAIKKISRLELAIATRPKVGTPEYVRFRVGQHIKRIWGIELKPAELKAFNKVFKERHGREPIIGDFTRRRASGGKKEWKGSYSDVNKTIAEILAKVRPLSGVSRLELLQRYELFRDQVAAHAKLKTDAVRQELLANVDRLIRDISKVEGKEIPKEKLVKMYMDFAKSKHAVDLIKLTKMAKKELELGIGDRAYKRLMDQGIIKSTKGRWAILEVKLYEKRLAREIQAIKDRQAELAKKQKLKFEQLKGLSEWEQKKLSVSEGIDPQRAENQRALDLLIKGALTKGKVGITKMQQKGTRQDRLRDALFDHSAQIDHLIGRLNRSKLVDKSKISAEILALRESKHKIAREAIKAGYDVNAMTTMLDSEGASMSTFWRMINNERGEFNVLDTVKGLKEILKKIDGFMLRTGLSKFLYRAKNMVRSDLGKTAINLLDAEVDPRRNYYNGYFRVLLEDIGLFGRDLFKKGLSAEQAKQAFWYRHGVLKVGEISPEIREVADGLTPILHTALTIARKAGIKNIRELANYTPKPWKRDYVEKVWTDLVTLHKEAKVKMGESPSEAEAWQAFKVTAEAWIKNDRFSKKTKRGMVHLKTTGQAKSYAEAAMLMDEPAFNNMFKRSAHLERWRKAIDMPKEFYEDDLRIVMGTYISDFAKRVAEVEVLGQRGERMQALISKMHKQGYGRDAEIVEQIVKMYTGAIYRDQAFLGKKFRKFTQAFMGYQVATKIGLGLATIPQFTQSLISTFPIVRLQDWVGAGFDILSSPKRRWAKLTGAPSQAGTRAYFGLQPTGLAGKAAELTTKASGFQLINKALQYHSAFAMNRWARYLYKTANSKSLKRSWARRQMKRWKLPTDRPLTEADIIKAAGRFASKTQLIKNVLDEPMMMNHPALAWLALFKRFGYKQAALIKDNVLVELKYGNPVPLLKLAVGGAVGGEAVGMARNAVKTFLSGRKHYRDDDEFFHRLANNFALAGVVGWVSDIARTDRFTTRSLISNITTNAQFLALPVAYSDPAKTLAAAEKWGKSVKIRGLWPATRRAIPDIVRIGGGVLIGQASERLKTKVQARDTQKSLRSRARQRALDFYLDGQWNRGRKSIRRWNQYNRGYRLSYPTIKEIYAERKRRRKLEKEY